MRVLIACEESQTVCIAFRERGHEAYSCDVLSCSGGHPEWHIKRDIFSVIKPDNVGLIKFSTQDDFWDVKTINKWDLIISFQPCTDLAISGAKHFWYKRDNGSQEKSIRFFFEVWKHSNCSENPIGILNGGDYIKEWFPILYNEMKDYGFPFKPSQIIQPWQFGHGEMKGTCLWLRGIPPLKHSDRETLFEQKTHVSGREQRIWKMPPSKDRSKLRSKTYPGIARAMAQQWG